MRGDVDVWTFTAIAGERVAVHIGETTDADDSAVDSGCGPPTGSSLGDTAGVARARHRDVVAAGDGHLMWCLLQLRSGVDGSGTYQYTMTHNAGADHGVAGRQGGPLTNARRTRCDRAG